VVPAFLVALIVGARHLSGVNLIDILLPGRSRQNTNEIPAGAGPKFPTSAAACGLAVRSSRSRAHSKKPG
jgi:hypothetical protein